MEMRNGERMREFRGRCSERLSNLGSGRHCHGCIDGRGVSSLGSKQNG